MSAAFGIVIGVVRRVVRDQPGSVRRVQGIEELGAERPRQGADREQEARVAFRPDPFAVCIEPAASHQDMDVEVAAQILGPGMQDQGERRFRAEPAGVAGEFGERFGDAAQQRVIRPLAVKPRQAVQPVRQRKDQVCVRGRQQFGDAPPHPLVFCARLAGGAMAVAARMEDVFPMAAVVAFHRLAAQGRGAAVEHGAHGFRLRPADTVRVKVFLAECLENLRQRSGHFPRPAGSVRLRQGGGQVEGVGGGGRTPLRRGHVQVDAGGGDLMVAEQALHGDQIDRGFQQMGGEAVAQRVDAAGFDDARPVARLAIAALGGLDIHRAGPFAVWEQPSCGAIGAPIATERLQQGRRQQRVTAPPAFACADAQTLPVGLAVNVAHLQRAQLGHAKTRRIRREQQCAGFWRIGGGEQGFQFCAGQYLRLALRRLRHRHGKHRQIPLQHRTVKEPASGGGLVHRAERQLAVPGQMKQPGFDLPGRQPLRADMVKARQFGDGLDIGFPGAQGQAAHQHGVMHLLA